MISDTAIIPAGHGEARPLALSSLDADRQRWAKLTQAQRSRITGKEAIFRQIDAEIARTGNRRCVMTVCKASASALQARGFSATRLYNDYFAWLRGGRHWSALVSTGTIDRGVPTEAVAFIHGFMQRNGKSSKEGWRAFLDYWRDGGTVPGYGTWRDWFLTKWPQRSLPLRCPPDRPYGWGYENLIDKLDRVETAAARLGIGGALAELPPIPGTRAGMRPLGWVTFDDVKLDFRVHVEGIGQPVDVVALVAFDIATGVVLGFRLRPVLLDENGKGEKLKRRDSKALLVELLQRWGWPSYGMQIIQELGTAHVDEAFKRALGEATGGLVNVRDASAIAGTVWAGGFADRVAGNSRAKSWIESTFNPFHNKLAAIEGQTGRRYDVSPQDDAGRRKELKALVAAGEKIPAELRAQLRMPYRNVGELTDLISGAVRKLNLRTDHDMEGFERMLVWRFREGDEWMPEADMLDFPPSALEHILTDTLPETPAHRYSRLVAAERNAGSQYLQLHDDSAARLLEDVREIALERGQIAFTLEKKPCLYTPYTPANCPVLEQMEAGKKYLAYYDASGGQIPPAVLYVTDGQGRFLGVLEHTAGFRRTAEITDEGKAAIAKKKSLLKQAIARVNANSPQVGEDNSARDEHNLEVLRRAAAIVEAQDPATLDPHSAEAPAAHTAATAHATQRAATTRTQKQRTASALQLGAALLAATDVADIADAGAPDSPADDSASPAESEATHETQTEIQEW